MEQAGIRRESVCAKSAHCTLFVVNRRPLAQRDRLIKELLLPAPLAQKPIDQIDDGDINRFLGEPMKRKGLNGQQIGPRGGSRRSSQTADSTRGNRGAGDRGRTGDVQLGNTTVNWQ